MESHLAILATCQTSLSDIQQFLLLLLVALFSTVPTRYKMGICLSLSVAFFRLTKNYASILTLKVLLSIFLNFTTTSKWCKLVWSCCLVWLHSPILPQCSVVCARHWCGECAAVGQCYASRTIKKVAI